jgi:O-antigen/teichoic acid export membrane protein
MVARREFMQLDSIFFRAMIQSTVAAVVACTGVWGTIQLLRMYHIAFALRLLPSLPLAIMFLATVCNIVVFAEALYLRAHKQEKFMVNSIVGALWMVPAALVLGRWYGANGIAIAYLCGSVFIGVGFGTYTFSKYRRLWHAT